MGISLRRWEEKEKRRVSRWQERAVNGRAETSQQRRVPATGQEITT